AGADFPHLLAVDGALGPDSRDTGGGVDEVANVVVTIETQDGSVVFYRELHCGVVTIGRDGRFDLVLGSVDPVGNPLDLPFDDSYWLRIAACYDRDGCAGASAADPGACPDAVVVRTQLA